MGLTAALLGVLAVTGLVQAWHIYVIAFVFGTGAAFDTPARQAFVNEMVDHDRLANAVGLNSASFNLARMIGPAVAGPHRVVGLGRRRHRLGHLAQRASATAPSSVSLQRMRSTELRPTARAAAAAKGQLRDGLRYVRSRPGHHADPGHRVLRRHVRAQLPDDHGADGHRGLRQGRGEYGILGSILAVGSLAGSLLAARRGAPRQRLVIGAAVAFGVVEMVAGLMPSYLTFASILPLCGFIALTMITAANAFVQMSAAPQMRGRVMALYMAVFMGGTPIGAPLLGWIAEHFGARWPLIGGGALTAIGTLTCRWPCWHPVRASSVGAPTRGLVTRTVAVGPRPIGPIPHDTVVTAA